MQSGLPLPSHTVSSTLSVLLIGCLTAFLLSACGSSEPLRIPLSLAGASDMNSGGNAAVVRVYQLSSSVSFRQAPIESFWRDDEGVLGSALVVPKVQLTLYPEDLEDVVLEIHEATRYIAVAVDFRDPDADHWRQLFTIDEVQNQHPFAVQVGERRLMLTMNIPSSQ